MRLLLKTHILIAGICVLALPAFAARKDKPSGPEIALKARTAVLDSENSTTGEKNGKKIKLIPANLPQGKSEAELEDGQVIGVLETEAQGDETSLPPGKYNLFLAKEGNDWHTYAESGGRIVAEAARVKVEKQPQGTRRRPEIRAQGWCSTQWFWFFGWHSVTLCW